MEIIIDVGLLVLVIIALSEAFKKFGLFASKYIPALNLVLGIVAGIVYLDGDVKSNILMGLIMGLSASGLFDISKVFQK